MIKENDNVRTATIINLNECKKLIVECIGTKHYLDLHYHILKTRKQLELYDKEMGYDE